MGLRIIEYVTKSGSCPFHEWLDSLDGSVRFRVQARIVRLKETENFGYQKCLGNQLFELKFKKLGGGIRIYYGVDEEKIVVLLTGGNKGDQNKDIACAKKYWADYQANN